MKRLLSVLSLGIFSIFCSPSAAQAQLPNPRIDTASFVFAINAEVIDAQGRIVQTVSVPNEVNVQSLLVGMYSVRIEKVSTKFMIQR